MAGPLLHYATGTVALSVATGLKSDLAAVTAGLTSPFSSGPVESNVKRIEMIKRQMYGRAGLDVLPKRVLLVASRRAW
jgi:transposase